MPEEYRTVPIRNYNLPKAPRVFDVKIDLEGEIKSYQMQNIRGTISIDSDDVKKQIDDALR